MVPHHIITTRICTKSKRLKIHLGLWLDSAKLSRFRDTYIQAHVTQILTGTTVAIVLMLRGVNRIIRKANIGFLYVSSWASQMISQSFFRRDNNNTAYFWHHNEVTFGITHIHVHSHGFRFHWHAVYCWGFFCYTGVYLEVTVILKTERLEAELDNRGMSRKERWMAKEEGRGEKDSDERNRTGGQ